MHAKIKDKRQVNDMGQSDSLFETRSANTALLLWILKTDSLLQQNGVFGSIVSE